MFVRVNEDSCCAAYFGLAGSPVYGLFDVDSFAVNGGERVDAACRR